MTRFYKLSLFIIGAFLALALLCAFNSFIPSWDETQDMLVMGFVLPAFILSVYWTVVFIRRQKKAAKDKKKNWAKLILLPITVIGLTVCLSFFAMLGVGFKYGFFNSVQFLHEVHYEKEGVTLYLYEDTGFMDWEGYQIWKRDGFLPTRSLLLEKKTGGIDSVTVDGKTLRFTITDHPDMLIRLP